MPQRFEMIDMTEGTNTHFRHYLQQTTSDRLLIIFICFFIGQSLVEQIMLVHKVNGFQCQVWIHSTCTIANDCSKVMHFPCITCFNYEIPPAFEFFSLPGIDELLPRKAGKESVQIHCLFFYQIKSKSSFRHALPFPLQPHILFRLSSNRPGFPSALNTH